MTGVRLLRTQWQVHTGPYQVTALVDARGAFPFTARQMFPEASEDDWRRARSWDPDAFGRDDAWVPAFRCYLIRGPGAHLTLVDTGIGPVGGPASWAPQPGNVMGQLGTLGVEAYDIDTVVLTHLHEVHYGGSVTLDGTPAFPNARYVVQQTELDGLVETDPARSHVVEPLRGTGQLDPVDGESGLDAPTSLSTGIRVLPTPGHTPGHQSVIVNGGSRRTILTGDVLVHAVQLANHHVAYEYEEDPTRARASRRTVLELGRDGRARLGTAHLHTPFLIVE